MQGIAFIDAPATIRKILKHLRLWDLPVRPPPASLLPRKTDAWVAKACRRRSQDDAAIDPPSVADVDTAFLDDLPTYAH